MLSDVKSYKIDIKQSIKNIFYTFYYFINDYHRPNCVNDMSLSHPNQNSDDEVLRFHGGERFNLYPYSIYEQTF